MAMWGGIAYLVNCPREGEKTIREKRARKKKNSHHIANIIMYNIPHIFSLRMSHVHVL